MVSFGLRATDRDMPRVPATPRSGDAPRPRYFCGPVLDFLCLGGASLLLFPLVLLLPERELTPSFAAAALLVAPVVNHPHFAVSYQTFYQGFRAKAFGDGSDASLRARYIIAGIVVPVGLAAFLAAAIAAGDAWLLGLAGNVMGFLVGWHYVKQGYGMLMVDAALKRRFFTAAQKRVLLVNAYAMWAAAWLMVNAALAERALWGISSAAIPVPGPVLGGACAMALATTVCAIAALVQAWRGGGLPVNGVVAYLVSLYLWLLLIRANALWLAIVPALHSLQYLVVAGRYHVNRLKAEPDAAREDVAGGTPLARLWRARLPRRLARFVVTAAALGFLGFWGLPVVAAAFVPYDQAALGATAFLFAFWVFINVHHYFLDSVMWRSRNPEVRRFLFS
jgi:hypothetical protein